MISTIKKILLTSIILTCPLHTTIKAVNENTAKNIAAASGILTGGAVGAGLHYGLQYCLADRDIKDNKALKITSPIIGIALGSIAAYYLHEWLYTKTPSKKIEDAKNSIKTASYLMQEDAETMLLNYTHDKIITKNFTSDEEFFTHIHAQFATNWPLILARQFLIEVPEKLNRQIKSIKFHLRNAHVELELATEEMQKNTNKYANLLQEVTQLQEKIKDIESYCTNYKQNIILIKNMIEISLKTIVQHPQFASQTELYEKHEQHKEMLQQQQLQHKEQIKKLDRLAQQNEQIINQKTIQHIQINQK